MFELRANFPEFEMGRILFWKYNPKILEIIKTIFILYGE